MSNSQSKTDQLTLYFRQGVQSQSGYWYNQIQWLGQGGNAVTYLMTASNGPYKGIPFAAKFFRKVSKPERRDRFLEEIEFLRDCQHPGIMRIFDVGIYRDDHPFVVSEYLPETLERTMRIGKTSMVEKVSFILQLLSALHYLSRLDPPVIHRDIKPQNVFVKGGSCVLGDFGLMKRYGTSEEDTPENVFKQSAGPGMPFFYRTPDQVFYARNEREITIASDIFQLGLLAAELFTGKNPEKRAEHGDFLSNVELNSLGFVPGGSGTIIANFIRNMLEFEPGNRPSVEELFQLWYGVFFNLAEQQHAIEGRVFER